LGWFIAEGWTREKGRIQLSQQDKSQIVPDKEAIGLSVHTRNAKIKTTNKALAGWLDEHVGKGSENKRIPEWVKQQSPERIEIFLETLVAGDGSYQNGKMDSYSTVSRQLADDVIECLLKTGRVGNINIRERNHPKGFETQKTIYAISISESESRALTKQPERIDYNGWVYCPTVENETLVTMRDGNVSISGNTKGYRMQTLYRERSVSDRPSIAGIGHIHGSMFAETEGVKGLYAGCWKGTTTYGKRKGHEANIGGWIIRVQISNGTIRKLVPEWVGFEERETANRHALQDLG